MIKAHLISFAGRGTILFGLSEENIKRLRMGEPIVIYKEEMTPHLTNDIIIMWGTTEQAIIEELKTLAELPPKEEWKKNATD